MTAYNLALSPTCRFYQTTLVEANAYFNSSSHGFPWSFAIFLYPVFMSASMAYVDSLRRGTSGRQIHKLNLRRRRRVISVYFIVPATVQLSLLTDLGGLSRRASLYDSVHVRSRSIDKARLAGATAAKRTYVLPGPGGGARPSVRACSLRPESGLWVDVDAFPPAISPPAGRQDGQLHRSLGRSPPAMRMQQRGR